jgi:hypothetical protein
MIPREELYNDLGMESSDETDAYGCTDTLPYYT